jgi:hypothetical protein
MHKTIGEATWFVHELLPRIAGVESVDVVICPAYPALWPAVELTRGSGAQVFAQNMHYAAQGPFTGEVSAPMLLEAGVRGAILGHSERRSGFAESDVTVQLKTAAALVGGHSAQTVLGDHPRKLAALDEGSTDLVQPHALPCVGERQHAWVDLGDRAHPSASLRPRSLHHRPGRSRSDADLVKVGNGGELDGGHPGLVWFASAAREPACWWR